MPMRLALVALLLCGTTTAALAQSNADLPARVDRVEKELRAVQRKVFPGGNPDYFEPQITAPVATPAETGTPATSAVGDLTARVNALESQVRDLTNQAEVNNHRLDLLEQNFTRMKGDTEDRLGRLETGGANAGAAATGVSGGPGPAPFGPAGRKTPPKAGETPPPPAERGDTMADQAAEAGGAMAPVATPALASAGPAQAGDPAESAYMAGYALWSQKRYGDAEAALKDVVAKYPNSKRASYAQNLIGRSYMDDGQLSAAADAFLTSYKRFPRGERAPDSLYYLGVTLTKLKKQTQACQVYDELRDVYGATLNATLKSRVDQGRTDAKCGA
jgi:TolA-binding protein